MCGKRQRISRTSSWMRGDFEKNVGVGPICETGCFVGSTPLTMTRTRMKTKTLIGGIAQMVSQARNLPEMKTSSGKLSRRVRGALRRNKRIVRIKNLKKH